MARQPTFPTLFDEVNILCLKFLKQHGYLNPDKPQNGVVTWTSRNTGRKSSINIQSKVTKGSRLFIELDYLYGEIPRNYSVFIAYVPSNLGTGQIEYFVCPYTKKHCRKLHCINGWFYHRTAFKGCYYDSQIVCKKFRPYTVALNLNRELGDLYAKRRQKYRKTHYRGKKTKTLERLEKQIELGEYGGRMVETLIMM